MPDVTLKIPLVKLSSPIQDFDISDIEVALRSIVRMLHDGRRADPKDPKSLTVIPPIQPAGIIQALVSCQASVVEMMLAGKVSTDRGQLINEVVIRLIGEQRAAMRTRAEQGEPTS